MSDNENNNESKPEDFECFLKRSSSNGISLSELVKVLNSPASLIEGAV